MTACSPHTAAFTCLTLLPAGDVHRYRPFSKVYSLKFMGADGHPRLLGNRSLVHYWMDTQRQEEIHIYIMKAAEPLDFRQTQRVLVSQLWLFAATSLFSRNSGTSSRAQEFFAVAQQEDEVAVCRAECFQHGDKKL